MKQSSVREPKVFRDGDGRLWLEHAFIGDDETKGLSAQCQSGIPGILFSYAKYSDLDSAMKEVGFYKKAEKAKQEIASPEPEDYRNPHPANADYRFEPWPLIVSIAAVAASLAFIAGIAIGTRLVV